MKSNISKFGLNIRNKARAGGVYSSSRTLGSLTSRPASTALVPHWYDGVSQGNFDTSANWQELSGGTSPFLSANAGWSWICSDSPANMIGGVQNSSPSTKFVLTLTGATAMVDLEDITSASIGGVNYLYGMDMGNNPNTADSRGSGIDLRIFRIVEPTITGSDISTSSFIEINCAFPGVNGPTLRDCEASFVDPVDGKLYIITKRDATQRVYSLAHAASYTGTQTLTYECTMTAIAESRTSPLTTTPCYAVSACISPNGKEILVKNYRTIYYFPRDIATQTIAQALQQSLVEVPAYPGGGTYPTPITSHPNAEPQGEAVWYSMDGRDLYTCSEYLSGDGSTSTRYPLFKYTRAPGVPTTVSFQDGVSPTVGYAGTRDTYVWDTNPTTSYGTDATFTVDMAVGIETDQRYGLLKFDLSSIPSSATIVGARLDLYIAVEGQGWVCYKMLTDWSETSTYNSITGAAIASTIATSPEEGRNGVNLNTVQTVTVRTNMLVSTVQSWVNGTSSNYGWLIKATDITGGDGVQFASREAVTSTQRPKLTIRYV